MLRTNVKRCVDDNDDNDLWPTDEFYSVTIPWLCPEMN